MSAARLRAAIWSAIDALEDGATWLACDILLAAVEDADPDEGCRCVQYLGAYPTRAALTTPLREGSAYEGGTA